MWGFGGKYYWGRCESEKNEGIVVMFAWMTSQNKNLKNYVNLYSSLGWNSLVCHSQFLNMFFPEKATSLASDILNELVKKLKTKPSPVVFVAFSGGPKACMYSVLQMIGGTCETTCNADERHLVRSCISGYIYDSSPVDFTSDVGTKFVLHPTILKMPHPLRFVSWVANSIAFGLDALFLNRFESQRSEYWQTLYSSTSMGAPYLFFCSENDDLAPHQTIYNFVQRLRELGANVKLVNFHDSPHVGHYHIYPIDYKAAVTDLLKNASLVFLQRKHPLDSDSMGSEGIRNGINLKKLAPGSSQRFQSLSFESNDRFMHSNSSEHQSLRDGREEGLIHLPNAPSIGVHGVFGQILFDACVPKNVEDWELSPPFALVRRRPPFNPIKCIRRSRL